MHISEGVLSAPVLAGGWALTAAGLAVGLKKMDYDRVMTVAILSAAFFVASLVHVPVGPASVHLILNGLLGVILGWACFPAIFSALVLQALLFQYGGLTVLGVNAFNMAFPALLAYWCCRPLLRRGGSSRMAGAFLGGGGAVLISTLFMSASLAFTDEGFWAAAKVLVLSHLPIMFIEGVITVFAVSFLARVQPEMLDIDLVSTPGPASTPAPAPTSGPDKTENPR